MTSANPQANPNDETPVEATGRCPIVLLLAFSLAWLLVSGTLAFIAGVQAHTPAFMAGCPILTYGHTRALQDTAFTYGWIANCGLALVTWILGRLGGHPLRAANWMGVGALFWNIAVAAGMVGIATGSATALTSLQIPGHIQPLMLAAYASIAVAGVLAALGDVEERANRPGAAVAEYEKAVKLLRGSGPETLKLGTEIVTRYAAALKADHRPEEARAVLRNLQASRAPDRDPAPAENAAASQPAAAKSFR